MNAFKRYLRNKKDIKLETDYPYLPYNVRPYITLEGIYVNSERATITYYYNVGDFMQEVQRNGELINL